MPTPRGANSSRSRGLRTQDREELRKRLRTGVLSDAIAYPPDAQRRPMVRGRAGTRGAAPAAGAKNAKFRLGRGLAPFSVSHTPCPRRPPRASACRARPHRKPTLPGRWKFPRGRAAPSRPRRARGRLYSARSSPPHCSRRRRYENSALGCWSPRVADPLRRATCTTTNILSTRSAPLTLPHGASGCWLSRAALHR